MFQFQDVVEALKELASNDERSHEESHCKLLEEYAKGLGFQSYHHFLHSLRNLPDERFGGVSLRLMREICVKRLPSLDCAYYEFQSFAFDEVAFYSRWAGWDKHGDEVRVPRALKGKPTATGMRKLAQYPVYVVESSRELLAWRYHWKSTALIPEELAREFFAFAFQKHLLVEKNPPLELVKARANAGRYDNNIAPLTD